MKTEFKGLTLFTVVDIATLTVKGLELLIFVTPLMLYKINVALDSLTD